MNKLACKVSQACKSLLKDSNLRYVFCTVCTPSIKTLSEVNYFDLYNLKRSYEIDKKALAYTYKNYQLKMHPDVLRQTNKDFQMTDVNQYSQLLSKSFNTLNDDLFRACYLLDLEGAENPLASDQAGVTDSDFMKLVFEINEAIESGENRDQLALKLEEELRSSISNLISLFEQKDYKAIKEELIKFRYFRNLDCKLKGILNVTYD